MKTLLLLCTIFALACLAPTCVPTPPPAPPPPPADAGAVDDGGCTQAFELAQKCPPCPCADAGHDAAPQPVVDAAPTPVVDAGPPKTVCEQWCDNAATLGCPEQGAGCVPLCNKLIVSKLTPFDPNCLAAAKTVAAVHACQPKWCVIPPKK